LTNDPTPLVFGFVAHISEIQAVGCPTDQPIAPSRSPRPPQSSPRAGHPR
jgi:hypothetical protein